MELYFEIDAEAERTGDLQGAVQLILQRQRDAGMRALGAQGANVLEAGGEASGLWDEIREIFGYDCEDEADDWWVQWGLLRERALGRQGDEDEEEGDGDGDGQQPAPFLNFAAMSVQVSSTQDEED